MDRSLLDLLKENPEYLLIAGIIVATTSLVLHFRKRRQLEARRQAERRAAAEAARESERIRKLRRGEKAANRPSKLAPDRMPLPESHDTTFAGAASPRNIAKWEVEIHQIGRQILGQIDSKMIALQTLSLEANRAANRLELLLEHLEQLIHEKIPARDQATAPTVPDQVEEVPDQVYAPSEISGSDNVASEPETPVEDEPVPEEPTPHAQPSSNLLPPEAVEEMEAFANILNELDTELEQINTEAADARIYREEPVLPATVIKTPPPAPAPPPKTRPQPLPTQRVSPTISVGTGSPLQADPLSLSSPRLPGNISLDRTSPSITLGGQRVFEAPSVPQNGTRPRPRNTTSANSQGAGSANRLSLDTLYQEAHVEQGVPTQANGSNPSVAGSRLALRKQVEMLADYGYTANQIAQNLNITIGEVDLMLSLRS